MRVEISCVGFDLYQLGNLFKGKNLSNEKVVEHLTSSKVVDLFTTIGMCKKKKLLQNRQTHSDVCMFSTTESGGLADDLQKSLCLLT